jgi:large subunit ribosomal protein L13
MAKPGQVPQQWWVVDATDKVLGRLATEIAMALMGKHRPTYTPHVDTGDFVVVVNAERVAMTGRKWELKEYRRYTGYPGQRVETASSLRERHPDRVIREAVRRMLPKNRLSRHMLSKLKIYVGPDHPHQAQQPKPADWGKSITGGIGRD